MYKNIDNLISEVEDWGEEIKNIKDLEKKLGNVLDVSPDILPNKDFKKNLKHHIEDVIDKKDEKDYQRRKIYTMVLIPFGMLCMSLTGIYIVQYTSFLASDEYVQEHAPYQDSVESLQVKSRVYNNNIESASIVSEDRWDTVETMAIMEIEADPVIDIIESDFKQACYEKNLSIEVRENSVVCLKGNRIICTQSKFLDKKCSFLE